MYNALNAEFMMSLGTDYIINKLFESLLEEYQEGLETKMNGIYFVFESADLLHYSLHKISLNRSESYKNYTACINTKKEQ